MSFESNDMKTNASPGSGIQTIPADQYHAMHEYLSNSLLSKFLESPAHLQSYLRARPAPTSAMELGSLIHTCILEPECLDRDYVVSPKFNKRKKDGKANAEAFAEANFGKKVIDEAAHTQINGIIRSVFSHDAASAFLQKGVAEGSIFWTDEKTGVKCRARIDYYRQDQGALVDVKSTNDARPREFQRSLINFGYHRQLAFYDRALRSAGLPVERHIIVAVEKDDPYAVMVYELDPTALIMANQEIDDALIRYAECLKTGVWPAYTQEIQFIGLPAWAMGA